MSAVLSTNRKETGARETLTWRLHIFYNHCIFFFFYAFDITDWPRDKAQSHFVSLFIPSSLRFPTQFEKKGEQKKNPQVCSTIYLAFDHSTMVVAKLDVLDLA
jgi:hypothetical protein